MALKARKKSDAKAKAKAKKGREDSPGDLCCEAGGVVLGVIVPRDVLPHQSTVPRPPHLAGEPVAHLEEKRKRVSVQVGKRHQAQARGGRLGLMVDAGILEVVGGKEVLTLT